ncbi:ribonuclease H-like domain-containing protein [Tanacetum coccineum]
MVTRFCVKTNRPPKRLNLRVSSILPLPKLYTDAFNDLNWQNAMCDEYNAFIKNNTWTLVPRPTDVNIVRCMWLFLHKYLADITLSSYKARLVANGSTKLECIDVDETFSPVVKSGTIHTVTSLANSLHWPVHQLDVKDAFLHDLETFIYFLGDSVTRDSLGMFLSQRKYAVEILERAHMVSCNPRRTPVDTEYKLGDDGDPVSNPTLYRSFAGSIQYITFTRSDISYAVQHVCLYMHNHRKPHFLALKRIEVCSWYRGVANVVAETCWLRNLLHEVHTHLYSVTLVYRDNVSAVYLSSNPVQHQRTKHTEIDIHFVRELVVVGQVRVLHVPPRYQYADIFTKGLSSALFEEFRPSLSVRCPPA